MVTHWSERVQKGMKRMGIDQLAISSSFLMSSSRIKILISSEAGFETSKWKSWFHFGSILFFWVVDLCCCLPEIVKMQYASVEPNVSILAISLASMRRTCSLRGVAGSGAAGLLTKAGDPGWQRWKRRWIRPPFLTFSTGWRAYQ